jgi:4-amino-4-deoxychorismate lyase
MSMPKLALRNAERCDPLHYSARWAAYGDGLFESIRAQRGHIPLLQQHLSRLHQSCKRLGLQPPNIEALRLDLLALAQDQKDALIKVMVCSKGHARGYTRGMGTEIDLVVLVYDVPAPEPAVWQRGLHVALAHIKLASQPALAGMKHLNRLEQVLARAEFPIDTVDEVLVGDMQGALVCATSANVLLRMHDTWITPSIVDCGVAGVMRAYLLQQFPQIQQGHIAISDLAHVQAMALCNAVRGIRPVGSLSFGANTLQLLGKSFDELRNFDTAFNSAAH